MREQELTIAVGTSRFDTDWKTQRTTVNALFNCLGLPIRGTETHAEFLKMTNAQQDKLKDVGGFVGGALTGPRRKSTNVAGRDLITLDFDTIPPHKTDDIVGRVASLGVCYCVYSTRKHAPETPRLRVVLPLAHTVSPDEYDPISRRVAEKIGIQWCDPSTFEASRLMYWPSCSSDSEFVFRADPDAPPLDGGKVLATYTDWHDVTEWPQVPGSKGLYPRLRAKAGDPTKKHGLVGAFCRTYDVLQAMDTFLPGIYEPKEGSRDHYTYTAGSTTGGAVVYEDGLFLFSHHATDPCSGRLCNSFDLVRIHKYGHLDDDVKLGTPVDRYPSYRAMLELAREDTGVKRTSARERAEQAVKDFEDIAGEDTDADPKKEPWETRLEMDSKGHVKNTINNAYIVLTEDPRLKKRFALDRFANQNRVLQPLPWNAIAPRLWTDTDSANLYRFMEATQKLTGKGNIDSALLAVFEANAYDPVQDYLKGLEWDGTKRLDTLFTDYLGADDTPYTRAVCRKAFTAAVARVMDPGCKFDQMTILVGPQGIGKSTLLYNLARGWFNDSICTFEGKAASELLQGVWLVEVSELDAFKHTDASRMKQFLSLRADQYRPAYGHYTVELPRRCVFFGTTNSMEFLQDRSGNRRFWPIDCTEEHALNSWEMEDSTIDQIWAEAYLAYQWGEKLYISPELEAEARMKQEEHRAVDPDEGMIRAFVEKEVPVDWITWDLDRRLDYWAGNVHATETIETVPRDRICALEIWCELFRNRPGTMPKWQASIYNQILESIPGVERASGPGSYGPSSYGKQRGFYIKATHQEQK